VSLQRHLKDLQEPLGRKAARDDLLRNGNRRAGYTHSFVFVVDASFLGPGLSFWTPFVVAVKCRGHRFRELRNSRGRHKHADGDHRPGEEIADEIQHEFMIRMPNHRDIGKGAAGDFIREFQPLVERVDGERHGNVIVATT
jgi:hypothetical protein